MKVQTQTQRPLAVTMAPPPPAFREEERSIRFYFEVLRSAVDRGNRLRVNIARESLESQYRKIEIRKALHSQRPR